jgi:hypothetical protein
MMKYFLMIAMLGSLGACSWFQGKDDEGDKPVVREQFNPCPFIQPDGKNHANCPKSGAAKGGICMPSGEFHSVAEKCDRI